MLPPFEEALEKLIDDYSGAPGWRSEIMEALESKLAALEEEQAEADAEVVEDLDDEKGD